MTKNRTMRVAVLLLALTLITSCFVGGTFAKYITGDGSFDEARVAKWGVEITASDNSSFKPEYTNDDGMITVKYNTEGAENLVAPGTKDDEGVVFSISGTPEVATKATIDMTVVHDVYLEYNLYDDDGNVTGTEKYTPVVFTLWVADGNGEAAEFVEATSGTLADIEAFLESGYASSETITDEVLGDRTVGVLEFAPGEVLDAQYKLTWEWVFNGDDNLDTILGDCAAGLRDPSVNSFSDQIYYHFNVTVEQVD